MRKKIILGVNSSWNVINFRSNLIKALMNANFDLVVVAPDDGYGQEIIKLKCKYHPLNMEANGKNPLKDFLLFIKFLIIFYKEKPDIFLGYMYNS